MLTSTFGLEGNGGGVGMGMFRGDRSYTATGGLANRGDEDMVLLIDMVDV